MTIDELFIRRGIVLASALVYWGGVWVQARRVRRHIGRSPNLKPKGMKERLIWLGWMLVVFGWMFTPFIVQIDSRAVLLQLQPNLLGSAGLIIGILIVLAGYAGTLWCYAAMGKQWRIGIDPDERNPLVTTGPYRTVRHPIYLFQMIMLIGVIILLPAWLPLIILATHWVCVLIKATDEQTYLLQIHGEKYRSYLRRTGMLLPPVMKPTQDH